MLTEQEIGFRETVPRAYSNKALWLPRSVGAPFENDRFWDVTESLALVGLPRRVICLKDLSTSFHVLERIDDPSKPRYVAYMQNYYDPNSDSVVVKSTNLALDSGIFSVCVEPTNRCTGRCPYCLIENHQKDPSFDQIAQHVSALAKLGVLRVGWGGGEPMVRSDIYELGVLAKQFAMGSLLRTSGMYSIDVQSAKSAFDWIDISFDSSDRDCFNKIRPGVNYDTLVENIERLTADNQRVRVSVLLTSMNTKTVNTTLDWLSERGIVDVRFQTLVKRGAAVKNWERLHLTSTEGQRAISEALEYANCKGLRAFELKSVSRTTLIILKPDGSVYSGDPDGQKHLGHILDKDIGQTLLSKVGPQQAKIYARG